MSFLNSNEMSDVKECVEIGKRWGYGNMINRLKAAWALHLLTTYDDFEIKTACLAAGYSKKRAIELNKLDRDKFIKSLSGYITGI